MRASTYPNIILRYTLRINLKLRLKFIRKRACVYTMCMCVDRAYYYYRT